MDDSPKFRPAGYSSEVRLSLIVGDSTYRLSKIGPGSITLREPINLPPCDAHVIMTVDGNEERWSVYLSNGATSTNREVETVDRKSAQLETVHAG